MIRPVVAYPFLLAVFPILSIFSHNADETRPAELVAPMALALFFTLLVWWVLRRLLRDGHRAGLITALVLVVFYTAGRTDDVKFVLTKLWIDRRYDFGVWEVAAFELPIFLLLLYLVVARVNNPRRWTSVLNLFFVVLVGQPAFGFLHSLQQSPSRSGESAVFPTAPTSSHRPDIYYIILDGLGRADVLEKIYQYDARPFLEGLQQRGFYVARESTSNYGQTRLSLASSLNASYLDGVAEATSSHDEPLRALIADGRVARTLRGLGYRFVTFATGYGLTDISGSDVYLSPFPSLSEFQRLLIRATPIWAFLPEPVDRDPFLMERSRTLYTLDSLPQVAKLSGPTFAFAHIISPHPPFIFGENGEDVADRSVPFSRADGDTFVSQSPDVYIQGYRRQVAFLTRRITAVIDQILANSPEPPIIILQSDHGPGSALFHENHDKTNLHERLSIMNAYYFPGVGPRGLYEGITPVNSFRVVFNNYFGAKLDLLNDRNSISTWSQPFNFNDVSHRVRPAKRREKANDPSRDANSRVDPDGQ
jgi:hypothetical protein